ncbi:MAG: HEAT repeat domain-containing protein [Nitrospirota bacterium]|nr:MAG: HEAT repeat domain-containing protein [Nitrospirota bacterium]
MRSLILTLTIILLIGGFPGFGLSKEANPENIWPQAPTIHIQVEAKTWKTRGRLYWDVEGSMIKKLAATGFKVIRNQESPHQLTLKVLYKEERGEQYDINSFGTVILGTFLLENPPSGESWELNISESSINSISGTPPYLDALDKFQTNPYYFFVGEILRGNVEKGLDPRGGLIYALELVLSKGNADGWRSGTIGRDAGSHLHTMDSDRVFYKNRAIRRAIDDCVEASDRRIVPVLSQLLAHPDSAVRIRTIEAMGSFGVEESRSRLLQMAQSDPDTQVRETAKTVEQRIGSVTQSQRPKP